MSAQDLKPSARERFWETEVVSLLKCLLKHGVELAQFPEAAIVNGSRVPTSLYIHFEDLGEVPGLRLKHVFNEFRGGVFFYARPGPLCLAFHYVPTALPQRAALDFAKLLQALAKLAPELKFERVSHLETPDASTSDEFLKWTTAGGAEVYENIARQVLNSRRAGCPTLQWTADAHGEMSFAWKQKQEPAAAAVTPMMELANAASASAPKPEPTFTSGCAGVKRVRAPEPEALPRPTIVLSFPKNSK